MCFSATASFLSAAVLSLVSLLSIYSARNSFHKTLALVPLFFGIQQGFEGIVWLALPEHAFVAHFSMYGFLFFALMFWPIAIPSLFWWYERIAWRRKIIMCSLIIGAGLSLCFALNLFTHGARVQIYSRNIYYYLPFAQRMFPIIAGNMLYLLATLIPLFISSRKYIWVLGVTIGTAYLASITWFAYTMLSVWCFFAAILSGIIGAIIYYTDDEKTIL